MIRSKTTGFILLALLLSAGSSTAQIVPQVIKVQGFLTDDLGAPVDGLVSMTFDLYDAQRGGNLIHHVGPLRVEVNAGVYEVNLSLTASDFAGPERYLEITVEGELPSARASRRSPRSP